MVWMDVLLLGKLLILLAAIALVLRRNKLAAGRWFLVAQLGLATVTELIADVYLILERNNLQLYNTYLFLEFALLMAYAYHQWEHRYYRTALLCSVPVFLLVAVPDLLHAWPLGEFASRGFMAASALLLAAVIALLFHEALFLDRALFKRPTTWILLGMVLYFGGSMPILGLLNAITAEDGSVASQLYSIMDVLYFLRYGAIFFGLLLFKPLRA